MDAESECVFTVREQALWVLIDLNLNVFSPLTQWKIFSVQGDFVTHTSIKNMYYTRKDFSYYDKLKCYNMQYISTITMFPNFKAELPVSGFYFYF